MSEPAIEHAVQNALGAWAVHNPDAEGAQPLDRWLAIMGKAGIKVYRRTITIHEDWKEVTNP